MLNTWAIVDRSKLNEYIKSILDNQPEKSLILLKSITPTFSSSLKPEPYKASFRDEEYQFIKNSLDANYIYEIINKTYRDELNKEEVFWGDFDIEQTDVNILRQFVYWYKQDR